MDRLVIERVDDMKLYRVRYNSASMVVPWWRIESAVRRLVKAYHARYGGGM